MIFKTRYEKWRMKNQLFIKHFDQNKNKRLEEAYISVIELPYFLLSVLRSF